MTVDIRRVAVYLGATTPHDKAFVEAVVSVGKYLADHQMALVYGGSNEGTMKILADAVESNGGRMIGVFTADLPVEHLRPGLAETHIARNLAERKQMMLERADALIALPGSFGTWDELFDALAQAKLDAYHGRPVKPIGVLNVKGFFDGLMTFVERSCQEGYTASRYASLLTCGDTVEGLFEKFEKSLSQVDCP